MQAGGVGHRRMMHVVSGRSSRQFSTLSTSPSRLSSPVTAPSGSHTHLHHHRFAYPTTQPSQSTTAIVLEIRRHFESESAYHRVADETLEDIQDAVEMALEDHSTIPDEYEVVLASGVLTMTLPPHGTWVLNKQTPNRVSAVYM